MRAPTSVWALAAARAGLAALVAGLAWPAAAAAEDRVDSTVTWFQERRSSAQSLTVLHPQFDVGIDLGERVVLGAGYEADVVSGATPSLYAAPRAGETVDAVSAATTFTDTRHSGKASLGLRGRRSTLDLGYVYGTERDYRSHAATVAGSVDLPGKNTNFGLSYTRNFDQVCDYDNGDATPLERRPLSGENPCFSGEPGAMTTTHDVDIDTVSAAVTQNLSPTAVMQMGLYGQVVRGFQSNPYRRVRVTGLDAQENVPRTRARGALFARFHLALPRLFGAAGLYARGYSDTWGIDSLSLEGTYHQYLGRRVLFRFRGRVYQQTSAVFFRDAIDYQNVGPVGQYFTGDRELGPLRTWLAGAKLSYLSTAEDGRPVWGLFDEVDFHLKAEGLWSTPLTETPPGGDVAGPLPDAIVAQLGLLLRY